MTGTARKKYSSIVEWEITQRLYYYCNETNYTDYIKLY